MICHLFSGRLSRLSALLLSMLSGNSPATAAERPPNIVIIFSDDLGYGDIGCFGARGFSTPNLDRMAAEGRKFTGFYVAQAVCCASRAALLTGCYPNRIGMLGAPGPNAKFGIHPHEVLLPELCQQQGYATGDLRQVAPGPPPAVPADAARLRRVLRPAVLERHVAVPPEVGRPRSPLPLIEGDKIVNPAITPAIRRSSPPGTPSGR